LLVIGDKRFSTDHFNRSFSLLFTPIVFAMSSEDKHRLINFYTDVPAVKKILGDRKDEQVRLTGIPTRQHILFTGGTGSGKTTAAANLLAFTGRVPKGTFTEIHLVRKTSEAI
jgi:Flp pilus assembly CpaF family ATPase